MSDLLDRVPTPKDNMAAVLIIAGILVGSIGVSAGLMVALRKLVQYFGGWQ
jgi:hypothetical protein